MLSLAGIPLTAGFIGKFMMFSSVMQDYHIILLILAVVNAGIGVYYYLKVVVAIYFRSAEGELVPIEIPLNFKLVLGISAIVTLLIGIYPDCIIKLL